MSETTYRRDAVGRGYVRVWAAPKKNEHEYGWGVVTTPDGYVWVYWQEGYTRFAFIRDGYEHERIDSRTYSQRGLATIAKRFAKDVIAGRVP